MKEPTPWQVLNTDLRDHRERVVRDWTLLLDDGAGERACLAFLRDHAGFFFCDSARRLMAISELELGADFRPDFVVANDLSSYGLFYEFIEVEDPNENAMNSKAQPSARLNAAISQVQRWRLWLDANRAIAKKVLPSREFWKRDRLAARYTIIIGRRRDADEWSFLRNYYSDQLGIQIRSFDHLTDTLTERYFFPVPNLASSEMDQVDVMMRNRLVNPFRRSISSGRWRSIAPMLADDHMTAKNAEILVESASTNKRLPPFLEAWGAIPLAQRESHIAQLWSFAKPR